MRQDLTRRERPCIVDGHRTDVVRIADVGINSIFYIKKADEFRKDKTKFGRLIQRNKRKKIERAIRARKISSDD
jgi:hypothetical protein